MIAVTVGGRHQGSPCSLLQCRHGRTHGWVIVYASCTLESSLRCLHMFFFLVFWSFVCEKASKGPLKLFIKRRGG